MSLLALSGARASGSVCCDLLLPLPPCCHIAWFGVLAAGSGLASAAHLPAPSVMIHSGAPGGCVGQGMASHLPMPMPMPISTQPAGLKLEAEDHVHPSSSHSGGRGCLVRAGEGTGGRRQQAPACSLFAAGVCCLRAELRLRCLFLPFSLARSCRRHPAAAARQPGVRWRRGLRRQPH